MLQQRGIAIQNLDLARLTQRGVGTYASDLKQLLLDAGLSLDKVIAKGSGGLPLSELVAEVELGSSVIAHIANAKTGGHWVLVEKVLGTVNAGKPAFQVFDPWTGAKYIVSYDAFARDLHYSAGVIIRP